MYSKQESQRLKHEFWIAFAEAYPRKWLLYDTKIKDFAFKFFADNKTAQVMIAVENKDEEKRHDQYEKLWALRAVLHEEHLPEAVFEKNVYLENKTISKVWVEKTGLSMNNRAHWPAIFDFFAENMSAMEYFFFEFEDYLKS